MSATTYTPETFVRRWLPADTEVTTWDAIEPWYRQLLARPIGSPEELERWLADCDELNAAVGQEGDERYIAMTCQTDDPKREAAHLAFVRDIRPKLKPLQNELRSKYLDSPHRAGLPRDRYEVFDRAQSNRRDLYREANIPRETELAELDQQYQKIVGAMTVQFDGEERTPAQMAPVLEETDRDRRQAAWEVVAARRLEDRDRLDDLFDRMIALRQDIAREAGSPASSSMPTRPVSGSTTTWPTRGRSRMPSRRSSSRSPGKSSCVGSERSGSTRSGPGTFRSTLPGVRRSGRSRTWSGWPRDARRYSTAWTPSWGPSSPTSAATSCSTSPTARARPPAATRRHSRTTACRSSS
jgi:hypothetical protein